MMTSLSDVRLEIDQDPIDEVRNSLLREKITNGRSQGT